jgi:hypothetical protein
MDKTFRDYRIVRGAIGQVKAKHQSHVSIVVA